MLDVFACICYVFICVVDVMYAFMMAELAQVAEALGIMQKSAAFSAVLGPLVIVCSVVRILNRTQFNRNP